MARQQSWTRVFKDQHDRAAQSVNLLAKKHKSSAMVQVGTSIVGAILALTSVNLGQLLELRRIRKFLERPGTIVSLGLSGRVISKEGNVCPDIGTFNPDPSQDVLFATNVQWAGTPGAVNLNWTVDNGAAGTLDVRPDKLAARLVTSGSADFEAIVAVSDSATGITDSARIVRSAGVITAIGLSATLVPKNG